jgi:hypothetical protein
VGSRLTGKRLGRRLAEWVNGGGAAAGIRASETALRGWDRRTTMGFAARCSEWGRRREKESEAWRRRPTPFWEGAGEAGGAVGVGESGRCVEEVGHEQGGSLSTDGQHPADNGPRPAGEGDVRRACVAGRTEGEGRG